MAALLTRLKTRQAALRREYIRLEAERDDSERRVNLVGSADQKAHLRAEVSGRNRQLEKTLQELRCVNQRIEDAEKREEGRAVVA
jgi:hypothetical protein